MMKTLKVVLLLMGEMLTAQTNAKESLGSGRRGWVFGKLTFESPREVVIGFDPAPNPEMSELPYVYLDGYSSVVSRDTIPEDQLRTLPSNFWNGWYSVMCFSFDENELFSWSDLFRVEQGRIKILPGHAQTEARKRFGLKSDQIYLGCINARRFYFERGKPNELFYFDDCMKPRQVFRLKVPDHVLDLTGVAKGNPEGDIAVWASAKPLRKTQTPSVPAWFVLNYKEAVLVK